MLYHDPLLIVYILNVGWALTEGLVEDWSLHQTSHPLKIKNLLIYNDIILTRVVVVFNGDVARFKGIILQ